MWVRKTPAEIKAEITRIRRDPKKPIFLGTVLWLLMTVIACTDVPLTVGAVLGQALRFVPAFFIAAIAVFILQHVLPPRRRLFPRDMASGPLYIPISGNFQICDRCFETRNQARDTNCSCGGRWEPFEDWKWVNS